MRLSKQMPQKRIAAYYIDIKSSVLSSFLKAVKVGADCHRWDAKVTGCSRSDVRTTLERRDGHAEIS